MIIIGCGKTKLTTAAEARALYTGQLFKARRAYAERKTRHWFILSAKLGLVEPTRLIEPYDVTVRDLNEFQRAAWTARAAASILDVLAENYVPGFKLREVKIEIHAGEDYAAPLMEALKAHGIGSTWPVRGLGIGEQLKFYNSYCHFDGKGR